MKSMYLIFLVLIFEGISLAIEPSEQSHLPIPKDAKQLDHSRISIPQAHKAKLGLLLFQKLAGEKSFCVLTSAQASELAGAGFKAADGTKTILVKWSYLEPVDEDGIDSVKADEPSVYLKDDVLYISTHGVDIGEVAKKADGVIMIQIEKEPKAVIEKFQKTGW